MAKARAGFTWPRHLARGHPAGSGPARGAIRSGGRSFGGTARGGPGGTALPRARAPHPQATALCSARASRLRRRCHYPGARTLIREGRLRMSSTTSTTSPAIATFRKLHESGCFMLPNPWDIGSAVFLWKLGFKALASTSAGFAFSRGVSDDVGAIPRDEVLTHLRELVSATP